MKNPIFEKEKAVMFRSNQYILTIIITNIILAVVGSITLLLIVDNVNNLLELNYATLLNQNFMIVFAECIIVVFIVPAQTAGAVAGEMEQKTFDLLLVTGIRPADIIIGKLQAAIMKMYTLILSTLPVLSLFFIYGGINLTDLVVILLLLMVIALYIGSIGVYYSTITKRSLVAMVYSYVSVFFLTIGTLLCNVAIFALDRLMEKHDIIYSFLASKSVVYLLLLNPLVTFYVYIQQQIGDPYAMYNFVNQYVAIENNFVFDYWIVISIGMQILFTALYLYLATKNIDPLAKKIKR